MNGGKRIVYLILILIPVLFILFLLAMVNVLLMLLGVIVILAALVFLKRAKPELFQRKMKNEAQPLQRSAPTTISRRTNDAPQVYMVLTGREDFGARRIMVNKTCYNIGRSTDNDFVIEGAEISRHHLRIEYNTVEKVSYAIDMGSTGGTYLNSERMVERRRYRLVQGDQLMIDDRPFVVNYAHY